MAVVARARRARRLARRSARRLAGLALLALAFGFGSWHPAAAAPSLAPAELIAAPVAVIAHGPDAADPLDLVAPVVTVSLAEPHLAPIAQAPGVPVGKASIARAAAAAGTAATTASAGVRVSYDLASAQVGAGSTGPQLSAGSEPVDVRPLALAAPVDTRVRGRAVRSAAATRAPPHAS